MEKKTYSKPTISAQRFEPQEYCVPCGDGATEVTYYFMCDCEVGSYVWLETNEKAGLQAKTETNFFSREQGVWNRTDNNYDLTWASRESRWGNFSPCRQRHQVTVPAGTSIDDIFPHGYVSYYTTGRNATPVRVWTDGGTNTHVTTHLDQSSYTPHNPS